VPFYKKLPLTGTDLQAFPILTKDILRSQADELISERADRAAMTPNASGGSTGKPVRLFQDKNYWEHATASSWFVQGWWGLRPGERTAAIWGNDRDVPPQNFRERVTHEVLQQIGCNAFRLDEQSMLRFAQLLVRWQPRFVIGYATALDLFARFLLSHPELKVRPLAVKSTAEVLTQEERTRVEQAFGAPVYDFYGSREVNNVAAECRQQKGLHVNSINRFVEIVDEKGAPTKAGVPGRVLVTDLTNYSMPMIRYENEDIAAWETGECPCGRNLPRLGKILGRKSDFLLSRSGRIIHGEFFTHLFYGISEVSEFQVVQESLDLTRVDIVLQPGATTFDSSALVAAMKDALGEGVTISVQTVPRLDRPPSGKHRFTISKLAMPWGNAATSSGGG
jgi:phenylacetate-CoA ligase